MSERMQDRSQERVDAGAPRGAGAGSREGTPQSGLCCGDVAARLWEYLDAELTADRAAEIEAHLDRCQQCHPAFDFQRAYRQFLRSQAHCPVPPGLRSRVFRALLEEEAGRRL
jgi:anti-sigma factor (TIGR02949 family)